MIHIFHGEHIERSRKELLELRQKFINHEIVILDGKNVDLATLIQATESTSLFSVKRLVIVELFLSKRLAKKSSEIDLFMSWIKQIPTETDIVFWEDKEITKTTLSLFPKGADIALFKPDKRLFAFLDALKPKNERLLLQQISDICKNESTELLFAMLVRQFRLLIIVKDLGKAGSLASWQSSKLTKQAGYFTLLSLQKAYDGLLDIDIKIKSSTTPFPLEALLRLWLLELK